MQTNRRGAQSGGDILQAPFCHPHVPRERVPSSHHSREVPGDGTYRCLPQSRFRTLEKLQKQPLFKNSRAGLSPLGWPHPLGC